MLPPLVVDVTINSISTEPQSKKAANDHREDVDDEDGDKGRIALLEEALLLR
jgi:hypothetical protein